MGVLGMFLAAAGSGVVNFVLSLYLQQVGGFSPLATALAFLPFALALVAVGRVAPQLVGRLGAGGTTRAGLVIAALGLALLARLGAATHYWSELAPGVVLLAIGMGMVFAGSAVLATEGVAQNQAGLAGGVMNTAMELGPTVGLATLMAIAATRSTAVEGYSWAFGTAAAAYLVTALLESIVSRRRRRGH
jgi:MFS family permease